MVQAQIGQRVPADMSGLRIPSISVSEASMSGTITDINIASWIITVRLDGQIGGVSTVLYKSRQDE